MVIILLFNWAMIAYLAKGAPFHLLSTEQLKFTEKLLIILDYIDKDGNQLFVSKDSSSSLCKCSKHHGEAAVLFACFEPRGTSFMKSHQELGKLKTPSRQPIWDTIKGKHLLPNLLPRFSHNYELWICSQNSYKLIFHIVQLIPKEFNSNRT